MAAPASFGAALTALNKNSVRNHSSRSQGSRRFTNAAGGWLRTGGMPSAQSACAVIACHSATSSRRTPLFRRARRSFS